MPGDEEKDPVVVIHGAKSDTLLRDEIAGRLYTQAMLESNRWSGYRRGTSAQFDTVETSIVDGEDWANRNARLAFEAADIFIAERRRRDPVLAKLGTTT